MTEMITQAVSPNASPPTTIHESDLAGIRSATQWLLAAFGGTALVVVAGIQLADAWEVIRRGDGRSWVTLGGLIFVGVGLCALTAAAARVLVPDRTNFTDLLTQDAMDQAEASNIVVRESQSSAPTERGLNRPSSDTGRVARRQDRSDSADVYKYVLEEISRARGWLLPKGYVDFDSAYQAFGASVGQEHEALRLRLREVAEFARAEAASYRYQQLRRRLLGWAGLFVFGGLIALVLACHSPTSNPVTKPTVVEVQFTADKPVLVGKGLPAACAGLTTAGVAVGGSLSEPQVILSGTPDCPRAKITVTDEVGIAIPVEG